MAVIVLAKCMAQRVRVRHPGRQRKREREGEGEREAECVCVCVCSCFHRVNFSAAKLPPLKSLQRNSCASLSFPLFLSLVPSLARVLSMCLISKRTQKKGKSCIIMARLLLLSLSLCLLLPADFSLLPSSSTHYPFSAVRNKICPFTRIECATHVP